MIDLSCALILGVGNGRTTYLHPDDRNLILKIETEPVRGRTRWYERPPIIRSSNYREIEGYSAMILRLGETKDFLTRVYGWEETNVGPALLAENATIDLDDVTSLNSLFKAPNKVMFSISEIEWALQRYHEISTVYCSQKIYNHGLKPESVIIGREKGLMVMRLFDFKSIVYRQLVSPRYVPRGRHNSQMSTIQRVRKKFNILLTCRRAEEAKTSSRSP
jgi:hypothetical protein